MDPVTIGILTHLAAVIIGGLAMRLAGGKSPAAKPADPTPTPTPTPAPVPTPGNHPILSQIFAGHPILAAAAPLILDAAGPQVQQLVQGVIRQAIQGVLNQGPPQPPAPQRQAA